MEPRTLGLILLWLGTILLVAVLQHRIRKGALGERALEETPPIERWSVAVAAAGMILALAGAGLTVWGFL